MNLTTCKECGAQYLDVDWIANRQKGYCTATHKGWIAYLNPMPNSSEDLPWHEDDVIIDASE